MFHVDVKLQTGNNATIEKHYSGADIMNEAIQQGFLFRSIYC